MIELTIPNDLISGPASQQSLAGQWTESTYFGDSHAGLSADSTQAALELQREVNERALPAIEELAPQFPDQARELRECLARMSSMMQLAMQQQAELLESLNRNLSCTATSLGDFNIIREVGRGGMGVVYEAEQLSLSRRVALKVLPYTHGLNPVRLQRFRNEAQAAASLNHPNIVPVYAVGNRHGVHYYAMQLIDGHSGAEIVTNLAKRSTCSDCQPLDGIAFGNDWKRFVRTAAKLFRQLALALEHAHKRGVVHRDIKPANVMLDRTGAIWITDFGLAQANSDASLAQSTDIIGTLRYISPELLEGDSRPADCQSDIYALGATLFEFLTLKPMVPGNTYREIVEQIKHGNAFHDPNILHYVPQGLLEILKRAVAKQPSERYRSASEVANALGQWLMMDTKLATATELDRQSSSYPN